MHLSRNTPIDKRTRAWISWRIKRHTHRCR